MELNTVATPDVAALAVLAFGGLLALLSVPMWAGWTRRNILYGARTSTSMKSDENWQIINRATGRLGVLIGAALLPVGAVIYFAVPGDVGVFLSSMLAGVPVITAGAALIVGLVRAERHVPKERTITLWPDGIGHPPRQDEGPSAG